MKRDAAGKLPGIFGQQQTAFWWRVVARKAGEFFVEILKAETKTQRLGVFEKKLSSLRDLCGRLHLHGLQSGIASVFHGQHKQRPIQKCPANPSGEAKSAAKETTIPPRHHGKALQMALFSTCRRMIRARINHSS